MVIKTKVPPFIEFLYQIHFLSNFIDYANYSCPILCPLYPPLPGTPIPSSVPSLSSCPWVKQISSLASPFPILFLTSPCLFCTYPLCFLFPVTSSLFPLLADNPPCDLHFCDSVPVLVVCLVCFCFYLLRFSCC